MASSIDYDVTAIATKRFFATVQNKLHWAIHGQTAAEVVYSRADAKTNMGLTSWKDISSHGWAEQRRPPHFRFESTNLLISASVVHYPVH